MEFLKAFIIAPANWMELGKTTSNYDYATVYDVRQF